MEKETKATENPLEEVRKVQKKICTLAMTAAILLAITFLVFDEKAIAKGLILGSLFSIINFIIMGSSIPMTLGRSPGKARFVGLTSILGRYVILAVPLVAGIKLEAINFWAVVVGIFAVQIVTMFEYLVPHRFYK